MRPGNGGCDTFTTEKELVSRYHKVYINAPRTVFKWVGRLFYESAGASEKPYKFLFPSKKLVSKVVRIQAARFKLDAWCKIKKIKIGTNSQLLENVLTQR